MRADRTEPEGLAEQVAEALERLEERAGKRLGDPSDPLLVSVRSGARESMPGMLDTVLNLGLNDESVEGLARTHRTTSASPGTPTGGSCRCSATSSRGIAGERFEEAIKRGQARARRRARHRARRRRAARADRAVQGALRLPAGPAGAAAPGDPRGVRLVDRRARGRLPPHQRDPRRLGHRGQRAADGVRQQGRDVGDRRRVQPRRGDRRARAVRRLPGRRAGRGRRLGRAQHALDRGARRRDAGRARAS